MRTIPAKEYAREIDDRVTHALEGCIDGLCAGLSARYGFTPSVRADELTDAMAALRDSAVTVLEGMGLDVEPDGEVF